MATNNSTTTPADKASSLTPQRIAASDALGSLFELSSPGRGAQAQRVLGGQVPPPEALEPGRRAGIFGPYPPF